MKYKTGAAFLKEKGPKDIDRFVDLSMCISEKLNKAMEERNLTPLPFSGIVGEPYETVKQWLSGTHNFTLRQIAKIEAVLDIQLIKVLSVILCLSFPMVSNAQMDYVILGGGVAYQKFAEKPEMDIVLHTWGGYFFTNASYYMVQKTDWSPTMKAVAPPLITLTLLFAKELIDEKFSTKDIYAGAGGIGAAIVKFKFNL